MSSTPSHREGRSPERTHECLECRNERQLGVWSLEDVGNRRVRTLCATMTSLPPSIP